MEKPKKCGTCLLFDKNRQECRVAIIIEGKQIRLPVDAEDDCHFLDCGVEAEQIRCWVEDPLTKERVNNGVVKIEYPEKKSIDPFKENFSADNLFGED